jgi:hypothetical protein
MTMTVPGADWGLHAPFPLPWPRQSRSHQRSSAGSGSSPVGGPRRPPRGWLAAVAERLAARRRRATVPVRFDSARALEARSYHAAVPAATVDEREDKVVLSLDIPGADTSNTEVVWDAHERRLVVGVWQGHRQSANRRRGWPLDLAWYRAHWLPYCDGRRAEVRFHKGAVEVVVPWLDDPDPTPFPPGARSVTTASSSAVRVSRRKWLTSSADSTWARRSRLAIGTQGSFFPALRSGPREAS